MSSGSLFVQMPLEVLTDGHMSAGAKLFLGHLLRWDWGGGCWLTDKQLARELGVSVRSVRNHTKALEEAGHLWVFEDREGMTVRLVVRAGHVYPKPRGLAAPPVRKEFSTPSRARKVFNYNKPDLEVHETTDYQLNSVLVEDTEQDKAEDVVSTKPQKITEETLNDALEPNMGPVGKEAASNQANRTAKVLQDAGIAAPIARVLANRHSAGRIQAAVSYAQGSRGELLNKPGYVVSALQKGWKLPKWCYRSESVEDAQKPSAAPQAPPLPTGGWSDPASDIPPDWEDRRKESPYAELWDQVCGIIQGKIQPESFETWIQPCYISEILEGIVTLAAPNRFIAEWVEEHYLWLVQRTIKEVDESTQEVKIEDGIAPPAGESWCSLPSDL